MILNNRFLSRSIFSLSVLIYLGMALGGIRYGLPDSGRLLSYNPDETTWIEFLSYARPERHFNPYPEMKHPAFYLLVYGATLYAADKLHWIPLHASKSYFRTHREALARFYLAGRLIQVIFGALLLYLMWRVALAFFGTAAGNIAVFFLAVTPAFVAACHVSRANIPVAFLVFCSLAALLKDIAADDNRNWLLAASFLTGLAISAKFSALSVMPLLLYRASRPFNLRLLVFSLSLVLVGFLVGNPFILMAPKAFLTGLAQHHQDVTNIPLPGSLWEHAIYPLWFPFRYSLGSLFIGVSVAAVIRSIYRSNPYTRLLAAWFLIFYVSVVWVQGVASPERILVAVPVLVLLVAAMIDEGLTIPGGMR